MRDRVWVEHLTEICVIISLMGAGLALNRPLGLRRWQAPWRLIGITMLPDHRGHGAPRLVAVDWPAGRRAAAGVAVLAPTDPVLASEVRVARPPTPSNGDEVRFALTSEAGLSDGLAFPASSWRRSPLTGGGGHGPVRRLGRALAPGRRTDGCVIGVLAGLAVGKLLGWLFFRAGRASVRLSEHREGFRRPGCHVPLLRRSPQTRPRLRVPGRLRHRLPASRRRPTRPLTLPRRASTTSSSRSNDCSPAGLLFLPGRLCGRAGRPGRPDLAGAPPSVCCAARRPAADRLGRAQFAARPPALEAPRDRLLASAASARWFYLAHALGWTASMPGRGAVGRGGLHRPRLACTGDRLPRDLRRLHRLRLLRARGRRLTGRKPSEDDGRERSEHRAPVARPREEATERCGS